MDLDSVKVLVLGDSGVGKTSLLRMLCHDQELKNISWTVGCDVDVLVHEYNCTGGGSGTTSTSTGSTEYFVEFFDIAGSTTHAAVWPLLCRDVHGILLVHDLTNKKSSRNLRRWLAMALRYCTTAQDNVTSTSNHWDSADIDDSSKDDDFDMERFLGGGTSVPPVVLVGTKQDLITDKEGAPWRLKYNLADECGFDSISLSATMKRSQCLAKLRSFLDRVVKKGYFSHPLHFDENVSTKLLLADPRRRNPGSTSTCTDEQLSSTAKLIHYRDSNNDSIYD